MFYRPADGHGLPHNPFSAIISPRPIAWISTRDSAGHDNLAPYSFFNAVAYTPPQIMFATTGAKPDRPRGKDTLANIEDSGVFCVNIVEYAAREAMNESSGAYPATTDEFALASVERADCTTIACARVANAPASLECRLTQVVPLLGDANFLVLAEVVGIHMRDDCLIDGRFDVTRFAPVARLGYKDYSTVRDLFQMTRPGEA
ncbi:flavin reductase like domain protein [mine drainage metagenome]|uniref:Flavin reductase like domain protein n=1 Tax=mine drainage metagenome TaxID=410659 RepID=A0A1J5PMH9_9ZZZZ